MAKAEGQTERLKSGLSRAGWRAKGWNPVDWFGGVKQEFKKISWTSKDELKVYTKVTVAATFAIGLGLYLVDLVIQSGLSGIASLVKAITS